MIEPVFKHTTDDPTITSSTAGQNRRVHRVAITDGGTTAELRRHQLAPAGA
jgi:hypothetical protein